MVRCPAIEELERGLAEAPGLQQHLENCPRCRRRAERIAANNALLADLRSGSISSRGRKSDAAPANPVRLTVPGYEIEAEIHRGGQGVVYRALQRSTRRVVALKIMREGPFAGPSDRARFEREVQVLGQLKHPNIVTIHDSGEAAGCFYLVMDYVAGEALDAHIAATQPDGRGILRLFADICAAVQEAHARGIIHRDLKPSNIRIDAEGRPHVLDFGLAKLAATEGADEMTQTGQFVGSVPWASPEQAAGEPDRVDVRTDVYALGVMLYQMLTGRFPYDVTGGIRTVLDRIVNVAPTPPSAVGPRAIGGHAPSGRARRRRWRRQPAVSGAIDDEIDAIVLKCLQKQPERRYQSAGELGRDLQSYLAGRPIAAKRDSTWYILRKSASRHKGLIVAGAVVAAGLSLGLGAAAYGLLDARQAAVREAYERNKAASERAKAEAVSQILRVSIPLADATFATDRENPARAAIDGLARKLDSGLLLGQPEVESAVRSRLGTVYRERGVLDAAEVQFRTALRIRAVALGETHADVPRSMVELAEVVLDRGGVAEAEQLCRRALDMQRKQLGGEHADVAQSLDTLARVLLAKADASGAERECQAALAIRKHAFGEQHVDTAQSLETLARIALAAGNRATAESMARQALATRFRLLDDEHPDVVHSIRTLAAACDAPAAHDSEHDVFPTSAPANPARSAAWLRRLADALAGGCATGGPEQMWRDALALKRDVLGAQDADIPETLLALGVQLLQQGDARQARDVLREALALQEQTLGPDSVILTTTLEYLVVACDALDDREGVIAAYRRRYQIYSRALAGKDDVGIGVVGRELADALAAYGDTSAAEPLYREVIAHFERVFGPDHRQLAYLLWTYAKMLLKLERLDEAEAAARRALAMLQRIDPAPCQHSVWMRWTLADVLVAKRRFPEAEEQLRAALASAEGARFPQATSMRRPAREHLAKLYAAWGQPEQASHDSADDPQR